VLNEYLGIVNGHEILNNARTTAYLANVGSPFTAGPGGCTCPTLTRAQLEDDPPSPNYDTPATDPAPWYDVDVPASGEFLGALVLDVVGLDGSVNTRSVTTAIGGGGAFGPTRQQPRVMTWTVLLIGSSCCGADYGLHWLEQALLGCCQDGCEGESLELFDCCPPATMTRPQFITQHRRVLRRVALTSGPTPIARASASNGSTCAAGACAAGAELITVEFTLVAAVPTLWTECLPVLDAPLAEEPSDECIVWCTAGSADPECAGGCLGAPCPGPPSASDPRCVAPPPPAVTGPEPCFCVPIGTDRVCYDVDLTDRPAWSTDVPTIVLTAGDTDLRDVRLTFYEKPDGTLLTCDEIADANRCTNAGSFFVTFVPANGALTIDGQTGRATVEYQGGCQVSDSVFGDDNGGPMRIPDLTCAQYCFCVEVSVLFPPDDSATVSLCVSGRRY
jgi:hypothetical protein